MELKAEPWIGRTIGGCRLIGLLGQGGMGAVFRARHERLDREVAVKLLAPALSAKPDAVDAFRREARSAAKLEHPRIVQVYDVGEEEGLHYIVMQLVDGESAAERIKRGGPLAPAEAAKVMQAALEGLREAHRRGILHRDIKPANILLGSDGSIRLADFGLAGRPGEASAAAGTPAYMSPQQLWGSAADVSSDLYAAGATWFHLLVGRPPYEGPDGEMASMHLNDPIPDVRALRPEVSELNAALITKLLAKDPAGRPGAVDDVLREFKYPGFAEAEDGQRWTIGRLLRSVEGAATPAPRPVGLAKPKPPPLTERRFADPGRRPERPPELDQPGASRGGFASTVLYLALGAAGLYGMYVLSGRPPEPARVQARGGSVPPPAAARPAATAAEASAPAPGAWRVHGRLVDLVTLKPVGGLELVFESESERRRAVSAADGSYAVRLPPRRGGYRLSVGGLGYPGLYLRDPEGIIRRAERSERVRMRDIELQSPEPPARVEAGRRGASLRLDLVLVPLP